MDIRQFAYAGIDIYGILAETTGKTTEELKKMDITFEDVSKALIQASKKGGKYYKGQEKSAKTLSGQVNILKKDLKELLGQLTETLLPTIKKIINRVSEVIQKFKSLDQGTKDRIVKIGLIITALAPLLTITGKVITSIGSIISVLSSVAGLMAKVSIAATGMSSAFALGVAGTTALVAITVTLSEKYKLLSDGIVKLRNKVDSQRESWDELKKSTQNYMEANSSEINSLTYLRSELSKIVDENGKVKAGYEQRAEFITNELSKALGIEIELNDGIIGNYAEISSSLDGIIRQKKVELILNAHAEEYTTALANEKEATELLYEIEEKRNKKLDEIAEANKKAHNTHEAVKLQMELNTLNDQLAKQSDLVGQYGYTIQNYEELQNVSISGTAAEIDKAIEQMNTSWENSTKQVGMNIYQQQRELDGFVTYIGDTQDDIADIISNDTKVVRSVRGVTNDVNAALEANIDGTTWGQDLIEEMSNGIQSKIPQITNAVSNVATKIKNILGFSIPKEGALSDFDKSMPDMIALMVKGLKSSFPQLELETQKIAQKMSGMLQLKDFTVSQELNSTAPNSIIVNFNPQQMTEAEMNNAFNYINKRFGLAY